MRFSYCHVPGLARHHSPLTAVFPGLLAGAPSLHAGLWQPDFSCGSCCPQERLQRSARLPKICPWKSHIMTSAVVHRSSNHWHQPTSNWRGVGPSQWEAQRRVSAVSHLPPPHLLRGHLGPGAQIRLTSKPFLSYWTVLPPPASCVWWPQGPNYEQGPGSPCKKRESCKRVERWHPGLCHRPAGKRDTCHRSCCRGPEGKC